MTAEAFFHLARVEERGAPRDAHGRFRARARRPRSARSSAEGCCASAWPQPPRWRGARFAVALTHDVDVAVAVDAARLGTAARLKARAARRLGPRLREARARAPAAPCPRHRSQVALREHARRGAASGRASTSFVLGRHQQPADGPPRRSTNGCDRASSRPSSRPRRRDRPARCRISPRTTRATGRGAAALESLAAAGRGSATTTSASTRTESRATRCARLPLRRDPRLRGRARLPRQRAPPFRPWNVERTSRSTSSRSRWPRWTRRSPSRTTSG